MKIKIDEVQIEERQRETFGDLQVLAQSIDELGQLVPIIVEKGTLRLVAGERRLQAMRLLGKAEIAIVFQEDLTPIIRRKMELHENIIRKDLTWEEEVRAIAELVKMEQASATKGKRGPKGAFAPEEERTKGLREIAKSLGRAKTQLAQDVELAGALDAFPQLAEEGNKTTAFKRYKRAMSAAITNELLARGEVQTHDELKLGKAEELIKRVGDGTVDLVLFDPPFGLDLQNTGSAGRTGTGEDSYKFTDSLVFSRTLCTELFPHFDRVMKRDAALFVFFPIQHYQWFWEELVGVFGQSAVYKMPLIWDKGRGGTLTKGLSFSGAYEAFFYVRKGQLMLFEDNGDVFHYARVAGQKRGHIAEKPIELYQQLIKATTQVGATVLDPTFGSGASVEAALRLHRTAIGFEMTKEVYARACARISALRIAQEEEGEEDE